MDTSDALSKRLANRRHYMAELERRSLVDVEDLLEAIRLWSAGTMEWTEQAQADASAAIDAARKAIRGARADREALDKLVREHPDDARRACVMLLQSIGRTLPDDGDGLGGIAVAA